MAEIQNEINTLNSRKSLGELTGKSKIDAAMDLAESVVKKKVAEKAVEEEGLFSKAFKLFFDKTPKEAMDEAFHKTIVPKIKDTADAGVKAFSTALFHGGKSVSSSSGPYISSDDYYWRQQEKARERERQRQAEREKAKWPSSPEDMVSNLMFSTRERAAAAYSWLKRACERKANVTVREFWSEVMGLHPPYTYDGFGWVAEDLEDDEYAIEEKDGRYQLFIPIPQNLDEY